MTVLETRYGKRARMTGPARDGVRRFGRTTPPPPTMDGGLTKVTRLRELIADGSYEVDSQAVAAAILERLKRAEEAGDDARLA